MNQIKSLNTKKSSNQKEDASDNQQIEEENKLVLKGFHSTLNHSYEESEVDDESECEKAREISTTQNTRERDFKKYGRYPGRSGVYSIFNTDDSLFSYESSDTMFYDLLTTEEQKDDKGNGDDINSMNSDDYDSCEKAEQKTIIFIN